MKLFAALTKKVLLRVFYSNFLGVWFLNWVYFPWWVGKKVSFHRDQTSWFVKEDELVLRIAIFKRLRFYSQGLKQRLQSLIAAYGVDQISFNRNDVVVDCGANIGEVGFFLKNLNRDIRYIAVEPDDKINAICCLNTEGFIDRPLDIVLSNDDTQIDFYISSDLADSSAIQPSNYSTKVKKNAKKLDSIIEQLGLDRIKLFKVEAEGFEPEVLQGSLRALKIIEYVAIDCGPERYGKDTIVDSFNILFFNGFKLVFSNFSRGTFLFRNDKI